jgi:hypothetical protein
MKKRMMAFLAVAAVLAAGVSASAAPQVQSSVLTKLDLSKSGVFANVPSISDIQAPASVAGAAVASAKKPQPSPSGGGNGRAAPDWSFTPGRLCTSSDPDFKEYRYAEHIAYCNRNVTQQMKQEVAAHYSVPQSAWSGYEFDHLIPLCIGGDSHVDNLWPQPRGANGSDDKDKLETQLYNEMSAGTVKQAEAVRQIYAWFGVSPQLRNMPSAAAQPVAQ